MAKYPQEFLDFCKQNQIAPRSHDWSVAWAAWCAAVKAMDSKAKGATK